LLCEVIIDNSLEFFHKFLTFFVLLLSLLHSDFQLHLLTQALLSHYVQALVSCGGKQVSRNRCVGNGRLLVSHLRKDLTYRIPRFLCILKNREGEAIHLPVIVFVDSFEPLFVIIHFQLVLLGLYM
jgi:hypothetical protein